jgi:hypothetical protein
MLTHGFTIHFPALLSWGGLGFYVVGAWLVYGIRSNFKKP